LGALSKCLSQKLPLLGIDVVKVEMILTPEIAKRGPDHCEELVLIVRKRGKAKGSWDFGTCSQQIRAYFERLRREGILLTCS